MIIISEMSEITRINEMIMIINDCNDDVDIPFIRCFRYIVDQHVQTSIIPK